MSFTLNNYWWLLIWLFTGGIFLAYVFPKKYEVIGGKRVRRWRMGPALAMVVPYVLWAGWRADGFGDTYLYRSWFKQIPINSIEWMEFISSEQKDIGFSILSLIIKVFVQNSDKWYFLVLATIQIVCLVVIFRRYSCNYWMSIFIFVATTDYLSWVFNGARQFTAVVMILTTTDWILEKKYVRVLTVILLASTIHGSALLMIPIIFIIQGKPWNKTMLMCLVASLVALVYVEQFTGILENLLADTQYTNIVSDWKEWGDEGMNPLRVLVYAVPTILSLVGFNYIKYENNPVINLCVNASIVSTAIAIVAMGTSGVFIGRLPIYVSLYAMCILLPWEIENIFVDRIARTAKVGAMLCYLVFFYFQMHFVWGLV